jgi:hypothetical protein
MYGLLQVALDLYLRLLKISASTALCSIQEETQLDCNCLDTCLSLLDRSFQFLTDMSKTQGNHRKKERKKTTG